MSESSRGRALFLLAGTCAVLAVVIAITGGLDTRIAGIPVRSRSWERPATLAGLLALLGTIACRRRLPVLGAALLRGLVACGTAARRLIAVVPLAAAVASGAVAVAFGTHAAGGADSYGYISQAMLFADGRVTDTIPLHPAFTWPDVPRTLTPLAFTRGTARTVMAPIYPPGLPLLMAPLALIDSRAVFVLVPLCAVALVWMCWAAGRALGDPAAGVAAAVLLSASPTFLMQAVQPMSDVPVAVCWLGALLLARRDGASSAAAAGALSSVAILVRPNLAPLAAIVVAVCAGCGSGQRLRRAVTCSATMIPGLAALALIQDVRYGSPLGSGYGAFDELFSLANVRPNLARYPRWLVETHTPFVWLWLLAPAWIVRRAPAVRRFAWLCYAFTAAVVFAYLPYVYFQPDEWSYTRFLLPGLPLMLLMSAAVIADVLRRLVPRAAAPAVAVLCVALAVWCVARAESLGVFALRAAEQKYPRVGAYVRDQLPPTAFVLALQHSGSVRYYSGRPTLRWDLLDRAWLDRAIASLRTAGYEPYAVLDEGEDALFRERFRPAAQRAIDGLVPVTMIGNTGVYRFE